MPQGLTQEQTAEQQLLQQQRISQQQLLTARLLRMSAGELEAQMELELLENPALERQKESENEENSFDENIFEEYSETRNDLLNDRNDDIREELLRMESDDETVYVGENYSQGVSVSFDQVYGEVLSLRENLVSQARELSLDDSDMEVLEYMIWSLDDDGFLRKELSDLCDELALYEGVDVELSVLEHLLGVLQTLDPAGVGARTLCECLRLQVVRMEDGRLKDYMLEVLDHHFNLFTSLRWDKIRTALRLNDAQLESLRSALLRLNPCPCGSLSERINDVKNQITPDFVVYIVDENRVKFELVSGNEPSLTVASSFKSIVEEYGKRGNRNMNGSEKEAFVYAKNNVDRATMFIGALEERRKSMVSTMRAIVEHQKKFFLSGEDSDLLPLSLKEIAAVTKLDISTISRVCSGRYAQTQWGIYPLRHFFSGSIVSLEGKTQSVRAVLSALESIVRAEDKHSPLSDEELVSALKSEGFDVARRTVAKYRERLGIPTSRLRKDHS